MKYTEEIVNVLKIHHLRFTKKREVLIALFFQYEAPLSVQDILHKFASRDIKVNKTTVYRELEQLQSKGIVRVVQLGDRRQYYELASREHHHHLICLQCERIEDIDMDEKKLFEEEKRVSHKKGFVIVRHSLEFFGLCKMCY